jgi:ketosteroid isomerase-like protein
MALTVVSAAQGRIGSGAIARFALASARYWSAMSQENVKAVHRIYEHLNRGDVEGVAELCADDFHMDMTERVFNPDTYRGYEGIRRFYDGVRDAWESYIWTVEDARVAGNMVVALLHCQGQSRIGGPGVDWRVAWLWKFQEGRAVTTRFYRDRERALEAAGLAE